MTDTTRFEAIHELFDAVQDAPADARPDRLAELTDDDSLRAEVLALFEHDHTAAIVGIERIAQRILAQGAEHPPSIPGIETHELLGTGAMGLVYRGSQAQPKRDVAIKVLRAGIGTPGLLRRFRAESDALARLRHPGIATVHQTGIERTPTGDRPYLVMELVDGLPLDKWLDTTKPSLAHRFELIAKVCDAVQHAHNRGVIHRDLKPSNILIATNPGATPEPKVIDFGVARVTDPSSTISMHTVAGEVVGTLAYMSPEQLVGDPAAVDTRSDVYTLGVIMFYVLAGSLPHDVTTLSIGAAARVIEEQPPKRPSSINPALKGDPETIITHALDKDKDRRYQTAEALAADIRRYLGNLPITARRPSAFYLLNRFATRNKLLVGAAALTLAALVTASIISTTSAITASKALADSERSGRATLAALAESERSEDRARRALADSELAKVRVTNINDFLIIDTLLAAHPQRLGVNAKIVDAIEFSAPNIDLRFDDDPAGEAKVRTSIGIVYDALGRAQQSIEQFDLALDTLRESDAYNSRQSVEILFNKANVLVGYGQPELAENAAREALRTAQAIPLEPDDAYWDQTRGILASTLQAQGKAAEAEPILEQLIQGMLDAGEPYPRELLPLYSFLYQTKFQLGKLEEMYPIAEKMISLGDLFGDPAARATAAAMDAWLHEKRGNLDKALEARMRGFKIVQETADPLSYRYRTAAVNTAGSFAMSERWEEAFELLQHGIDVTVQSLGPYAWENERNAGYMARMRQESGDSDGANQWTRHKLTLRYFNAGPGDDELDSLISASEESTEFFGSKEAFFDHLLAQIPAIDAEKHPEFYLKFQANIARVCARMDDPRCEQLMAHALEQTDPAIPEHKAHEIVHRARDLTNYLTRAGRTQDAAAWNQRVDALAAAIPE